LTTNGYLIGLNTDCIYWNKEKVWKVCRIGNIIFL